MAINISLPINGKIINVKVSTHVVRSGEPVPYCPETVASASWRWTTFALDDECKTDYSIEMDDGDDIDALVSCIFNNEFGEDEPFETGICHTDRLDTALAAVHRDMVNTYEFAA